MANLSTNPAYPASAYPAVGGTVESRNSAVSWGAVIAGAFVSAASMLILITIGAGFGLAAASPWPNSGASAGAIAVTAVIWLIIVQWIASGLGGYLAGRLRTKWVGTHTHEVFFRDTAHGFLVWAVATVLGVLLLTSATSSLVGGGVRAGATVAQGAANNAGSMTGMSRGSAGSGSESGMTRTYDVDSLFRTTRPDTAGMGDARTEAGHILAADTVKGGDVSTADRGYLADLVAARTGISPAEAQKRVSDVLAQEKAAEAKAREAADEARKAAAKFAIAMAVSMLIGAFIACAAASLGGRERDLHP